MKTCQEKMMALPNSKFAEMLRRRSRKYNQHADETFSTDAGFATALTLAPLQPGLHNYSDDFNQVRITFPF